MERITYVDEQGCSVWVIPNYLSASEQEELAAECRGLELVRFYLGVKYGRECYQHRLSMGFGQPYAYSGKVHPAVEWTPVAAGIRDRINKEFDKGFNGGLVNVYRNGEDYISPHSDDETTLAANGSVYGLSLVTERNMVMKWKKDKERPRIVIPLPVGSLFAMEGATQRFLTHEMPVTKRVKTERISVTLRQFQ